jgi:hypothetical protein
MVTQPASAMPWSDTHRSILLVSAAAEIMLTGRILSRYKFVSVVRFPARVPLLFPCRGCLMIAPGESAGRNDGVPKADRLSMGQAEAARMRNSLVLLIFLSSLSCARLQQTAAPAPQPAAAAAPTQAADATPVTFECSDGTKAPSLAACLDNMARARLPPSQQIENTPTEPAEAAH